MEKIMIKEYFMQIMEIMDHLEIPPTFIYINSSRIQP